MKKILLIEDNADVRENTAEILELSNYEVTTAENGRIGVRRASENLPDLIICDIMMPELDGFAVIKELQANPNTATIPFIFLTAKAEKEDFRKGMKLGADDYLIKPFDDVELLEAIELRFKKMNNLKKASRKGLEAFINEARGLQAMEELSFDREIRRYRKKDIIYYENDSPRHVFYVQNGKIKIFRTNEDGRELIVALINKGEFFGYLSLLQAVNYPETAVALEDSEIALIPRDEFFKLVHTNRDVSSRFIKMLAGDLLDVEQQLLDLAYNSVRKRVADALIRLKERYATPEDEERFTIAIKRDDLASMVGTAKETVIRMLSDFKEDKLIEVSGSKITIINEKGLQEMWQ